MKTMMNETPNEMLETNSRRNSKMKKFTKILKNQKGLTLIELLAVIVILGIVAAIAVPAIGNIINDSRDKAILSEATSIIAGAKLANANGDCGTDGVCSAAELASYVNNVTLVPADQVTVATWELTWAGLTGFSTGSTYAITSPATEAAILLELNQ